jgi:membrane-associated phospholipid phosphatase
MRSGAGYHPTLDGGHLRFRRAVATAAAVLLNWSWPKMRFVVACYTLSSALALTCYCVLPINIVRPSFDGPGLGCWLMRQVISVDKEANCFPSSHVFYALLGAILVWQGGAGGWTKTVTWAIAGAVCATTVTTGQHYFLDVVGGAVTAVTSYVAVRCLLPNRAVPAPPPTDPLS